MNFDVTCHAADDNDYPNESMEDIVFGVKPANPPKPATVTWRHVYAALVTGTQPAPVSDIERLNALLAANGIRTSKPVREVTAGMTVRHYSDAPSLAIYLDADTVLPTAVHEAFEPQAYSSGGRFWVVQLKKVS